jgi:hypothetical protein
MEFEMKKLSPHFLILPLALLMLVGCSTLELASSWKDRDITLDGKGGEWLGAKYYFEDSAISVGLVNDQQYLYVSMMTENPMIRAQVMRQGLTVWFDSQGGKNKSFGIKYPLGRQTGLEERDRIDPQAMMDETTREEMMQRLQESMTDLEILGPDEKVLAKKNIDDFEGIEVSMRNAAGTLVYEIKVPLVSSEEHPFAVGVEPGSVIGVGFLSPKMQFQRPGGMRGGGRVPGGGMPPGGGRGMPPGGGMGGRGGVSGIGRMIPQDLKIWAKVQLASGSIPALAFF